MADTSIGTDHNLTVKHWSAVMFKTALKQVFFGKFVGKGDNNIIETKTDLTKEKGDQVTFGLRVPLTGTGVTGDGALEGNEEAMVFHDFAVKIDLRANAVRSAGKMSLRRPAFDFKQQAKNALAEWMADVIDDDTVYALSGVANPAGTVAASEPTAARSFYGGQTTAGVLTSGSDMTDITSQTDHLFGTKVIEHVKRQAKRLDPKIRPVMDGDRELYTMFINPLQGKALRADEDWIESQQKANVRGEKNPIFSGASGIWDGVVIHEYERILTTEANSAFGAETDEPTVPAARALFCGAQAGVHAYGQYPGWYEKNFEYGRVPGVATDIVIGIKKPVFDSKEYGVIAVNTAVVPD